MKRKVIQLAESTFVVSLPTSWVKQWGVKKGEELDLVENGPRLSISTTSPRELKKGTVDASTANERTLRWLLSSLHKKGYDEIEITTGSFEHTKIIDELLKNLFIGFTIVHQTDRSCIIRTVSKELDDQFDVILRRAFLVTLGLADQTLALTKQGKYHELPALLELEKTNNQLTNFCERMLNKRGHPEPSKTTFLYVVIWNLEKIADDYKYILETLSKNKKINKKTIDLFAHVNDLLRNYYELFYRFDLSKLNTLATQYKDVQKKIEDALLGDDTVVLSHLSHIVMKTADFSASTFALND